MKLAMKQVVVLCALLGCTVARSFSPGAKAVRSRGKSAAASAAPRAVARSAASVAAEADKASAPDTSTLVSSGTVNLVKSIVGAGVLALPAGVGAFADTPVALVPAAVLVSVLGAASAYAFSVIGRVCAAEGASSYKEAWEKCVGAKTAFIVDFVCTMTPLLACLSYSMIIGDAFAALLATAGVPATACAAVGGTRNACISVISIGALWPLCSLRSLKALAPTSALGTAGVVYTTLFMVKRALDGTYAAGGTFAAALKAAGQALPAFGTKAVARPAKVGVFVAMLGTAFMAHFNAPSFFEEAASSLKTFNTVVARGFGLSVVLNVLVMAAGFLTFGTVANGLVLNNYASSDVLATLARALFGVSIVFTFPLAFAGAKGGLRPLAKKVFGDQGPLVEPAVVAAPLALLTGLALVLRDVGVIVSLTGALMGSAIIYILPAVMLANCDKTKRSPAEKKLIPILMSLLGVVSATLGVVTTIF